MKIDDKTYCQSIEIKCQILYDGNTEKVKEKESSWLFLFLFYYGY